jgi:Skp family chaperone for outer membrane proteins
MRLFAVALALSVTLAAASDSVYAQQVPGAPAPAPPAAQQPPPAQPAPAAPAVPFQEGFKYAYVNVQAVAAESAEGKAAASKIKALQDARVKELNEKNKALQTAQQKLESGGSVMSDSARAQLQAEIERQQRDIQRFTEDAQQDITSATQQAQDEFGRKLQPIIDKVAREKKVDFVFNAAESGLIWAVDGMNLTADVIKAFDAGAGSTATPAAPPPTQKP